MKDLETCMQELKFDTRMITKNQRAGVLTEAEYQTHLSSLSDVQEKSVEVNLSGADAVTDDIEEATERDTM